MVIGNLESYLQIFLIILLSGLFHLSWIIIAQFAMNSNLRKLNMKFYETLYIVHPALESGRLKDIILDIESLLKNNGKNKLIVG